MAKITTTTKKRVKIQTVTKCSNCGKFVKSKTKTKKKG